MNKENLFQYYWKLINRSIFVDERKEKNRRAIMYTGILIALFGAVMSAMNIMQNRDFAFCTTLIVFVCGCFIVISAVVLKNRIFAITVILFLCIGLFSVYAIIGMNDGFAILWTMIVPMAFSYIASVRSGIALSAYYEILFIVLFYTPIRGMLGDTYTETFMNRYPILYLCNNLFIFITMVQYHISVLQDIDYQERLHNEVAKQTHIATERAARLENISDEIMVALSKAGDAIPLEARIICVADCYDAMTSQRSYSSPKPQNEVREEFLRCKGTQFDPVIADIMIAMIDEDKEYKMRSFDNKA